MDVQYKTDTCVYELETYNLRAMTLCIRWWLESYQDARRVRDRVHRALQKALDSAAIEMPYPAQTLHLRNDQGRDDDRSE